MLICSHLHLPVVVQMNHGGHVSLSEQLLSCTDSEMQFACVVLLSSCRSELSAKNSDAVVTMKRIESSKSTA